MKVKVVAVMAIVSLLLLASCDGGGSDNDSTNQGPFIVYVDDSATGANNGSSWADAYNNIQDGVDMAAKTFRSVWVAEGTYASGTTDPVLTMAYGVRIYGGFDGTETSLSERTDPSGHPTYLDGQNTSYHVVVGASFALLDHFIVANGNANGAEPNDRGGGMYNYGISNLTVNNCFFSGNSAYIGGGMYNQSSFLTLTNCTFSVNSAIICGGINNHYCSPTITNCTFSGNSANGYGGGMGNTSSSSPVITNCTFHGNFAMNDGGGGMLNGGSASPILTNCTFTLNFAGTSGGGVYNYNHSSPVITNCTFNVNFCQNGGGMFNEVNSSPTLINCIMWGDTATISGTEIYNDNSTSTVTYSDIMGGYAGTGNINLDPMFVSGPLGDYYLDLFSPCLNAGTGVPSDYGLENTTTNTFNFPDVDAVDMGYHYPIP